MQVVVTAGQGYAGSHHSQATSCRQSSQPGRLMQAVVTAGRLCAGSVAQPDSLMQAVFTTAAIISERAVV